MREGEGRTSETAARLFSVDVASVTHVHPVPIIYGCWPASVSNRLNSPVSLLFRYCRCFIVSAASFGQWRRFFARDLVGADAVFRRSRHYKWDFLFFFQPNLNFIPDERARRDYRRIDNRRDIPRIRTKLLSIFFFEVYICLFFFFYILSDRKLSYPPRRPPLQFSRVAPFLNAFWIWFVVALVRSNISLLSSPQLRKTVKIWTINADISRFRMVLYE